MSGVKGNTTFDAKAFDELHLSRPLTRARVKRSDTRNRRRFRRRSFQSR